VAQAAEGDPPVERLSRPGGISRYAFVAHRTPVRTRPRWGGRRVAKLGLRTEDGTDELVLVLARTRDPSGRSWVRIRVPVLPLGTTGWIPQSALGDLRRVNTWLRIDRRRLRATLVKNHRVRWSARIGIGRSKWPTPAGNFYVRDKLRGFKRGSIYGPLAFGTSAKSTVLTDWPGGGVIGIHGTNRPELLPGRVSHGCVRLRNRDILRLARLMPVGTPVTVR